MADILVYSAVFGDYDTVRPARLDKRDYRLYTNTAQAPAGWEVRRLDSRAWAESDRRWARYFKTAGMPTDAVYTLWLDGSMSLTVDPVIVIEEWLVKPGADIALFVHPVTTCAYTEAEICTRKRKDYPHLISHQMRGYRGARFPAEYGLSETPVIARRVNSAVLDFNALWWVEIAAGSARDQLSFDYVRWLFEEAERPVINRVEGGRGWKARRHPWFSYTPHGARGG